MSQAKFNIRELDFKEAGRWPNTVKAVFCLIAAGLVVVLSWLLLTSGKRDELTSLESKEKELRDKYAVVAVRAANLQPLKVQMEQLQKALQDAVRQLPSKTQMPSLILDISQTANSQGLRTELFQPAPEAVKEFFAETPIAVRMVGDYHQFGQFVGAIASQPTLVVMTMEDITLTPRKDAKAGDEQKGAVPTAAPLELATTIKTYRYLDEAETQAMEKQMEEDAKAARKKAAATKKAASSEEGA